MYVIARHVGETIEIADIITIKLLSVNGNTARIGIEAPKEIPIKRLKADGTPSGGHSNTNK